MTAARLLALLCLLAAVPVLAACGDDPGAEGADGPLRAGIAHNADNERTTIRVGSKNFTEQQVLGEIYAQGLEAAGYRVNREFGLGDELAAFQALDGGVIDGYPEYTGTALSSLCGVPAARVPKDPMEAFDDVRACFARSGLTALPPTPFTSSNAVGVTQQVAAEHDLQQISDLARVDQDFVLYGAKECRRRSDCLAGLQDVYGLEFEEFRAVDIARRHEVLERGGDEVASIVFTTDPQIQREGIVLLEDDRGMFPPGNSTFAVRDAIIVDAGPDFERVIALVQRGLTDETMQELNARVDLDGEEPADVARSFLRAAGLVAGT